MVSSKETIAVCPRVVVLLGWLVMTQTGQPINGTLFSGFSAEPTSLTAHDPMTVANTSASNNNLAVLSLRDGTRFGVTSGYRRFFIEQESTPRDKLSTFLHIA